MPEAKYGSLMNRIVLARRLNPKLHELILLV